MQSDFVIRVQGEAGKYGLGELVVPGVAFFKDGRYDMTKKELEHAVAAVKANSGRIVP